MIHHQAREKIDSNAMVPYHWHSFGYVALVLKGGYVELGEGGRFKVCDGEAIYHPPFQAHLNRAGRGGATVLNLTTGLEGGPRPWCAAVADFCRLVHLAARDPCEAVRMLLAGGRSESRPLSHWCDCLALELARGSVEDIGAWARGQGLRPDTMSRAFKSIYGISPIKFRANARARQAWWSIVTSSTPLSDLAQDAGYADQAHMTRSVHALTARSPGSWRRLGVAGAAP